MKIYKEIVLSINTLQVVREISYEYVGPLVLAGGGDTQTNTQDPEFNARMAAIAERQQEMAEEYFTFWEAEYKPMESAQIRANMALMPLESEAYGAELQAKKELTPLQTEYAKMEMETGAKQQELSRGMMDIGLENLQNQKDVTSRFYKEALSGVNVTDRMNQASADVAQSLAGTEDATRREISRMGIDPSSGKGVAMYSTSSLDRARMQAAARSGARREAEDENFRRIQTAMGVGAGGGA